MSEPHGQSRPETEQQLLLCPGRRHSCLIPSTARRAAECGKLAAWETLGRRADKRPRPPPLFTEKTRRTVARKVLKEITRRLRGARRNPAGRVSAPFDESCFRACAEDSRATGKGPWGRRLYLQPAHWLLSAHCSRLFWFRVS